MNILKNKKSMASVCAILVALALIAGSTMAWFVIEGSTPSSRVTAGNLGLDVSSVSPFVMCDPNNPVIGQYSNSGVDPTDNTLYEYLGNGVWEAFYAQPGDILTRDNGIFDPATNDLIVGRVPDGDYSVIENTGNLNIIAELSLRGGVTRYWADPDAADPGYKYSTKQRDELTYDAVGYPGAPGAVFYKLAFLDTQDNEDAINAGVMMSAIGDKVYLLLPANTKVEVAVLLDLKTNAYYSVRDNTPAIYLDNTYFDCSIDFGIDYLATQSDMPDSWGDVFGIDFANDFAPNLVSVGHVVEIG